MLFVLSNLYTIPNKVATKTEQKTTDKISDALSDEAATKVKICAGLVKLTADWMSILVSKRQSFSLLGGGWLIQGYTALSDVGNINTHFLNKPVTGS